MKIERSNHILPSGDEPALTLAQLLHRIGNELDDMSETCRNVEDALGIVISTPKKMIDQPIVALQGLDRMRQTLEDLAKLTNAIARGQAFSNAEILSQDVKKAIILSGLAERLTRSKATRPEEDKDVQDVIWT